ncbi:MAG TPA: 50S ribosomal protein L13 [Thermoanaerobaculia bacterium]|jgi:large subunit ribosomal protein L13
MGSGTPGVSAKEVRHDWYVVDASNQVLGRLATRVARVLAGKHRPGFVPYLDTGDFVIVTNADKVRLTGKKLDEKLYRRHTGFPGGLRERRARQVQSRHPERLIEDAVKGMLPKSRLGRKQIRKLKVYRGAAHPHDAQKPKRLALDSRGPVRPTTEAN